MSWFDVRKVMKNKPKNGLNGSLIFYMSVSMIKGAIMLPAFASGERTRKVADDSASRVANWLSCVAGTHFFEAHTPQIGGFCPIFVV